MRTPLITGALVALVCSRLSAQQKDSAAVRNDSAIVIAPIEVVGSIIPAAGPVIGADVPARVITLTGQQIDAWEPRVLPDALASQVGVSFTNDLGSPLKLTLGFRGFSAGPTVGSPDGLSVFLDGVRQNEPDAGEVNFDLLPLEHIKKVELVAGTGSLMGDNSLSGGINLISARGRGPIGAELELSGGSYGAWSGEGSVSGRSKGGWDYLVAGGYDHEDGWRAVTNSTTYDGFLNLGHLGDQRGISFQLRGAHSEANTAGSLPQSIFDVDPTVNFTPGDLDQLGVLQASATGYVPVGPGRGSLTLYGRRSTANRFNVNQPPDDNIQSNTTNGTLGLNADWRWQKPVGKGSLALRAGADGAANAVDIVLQVEPPAFPDSATVTTDVKSPSWNAAGFGMADYTVGRTTVSVGFRYDYIVIPFQNQLDPSTDTSSHFSRLSPRGGMSVELGKGFSAYASAGQSFRAPMILELACADPTAACPLPFALGDDPPLDPVVATTGELGGRWVTGSLLLTGSVYWTAVQNDIAFIQSDTAIYAGYFANIGNTRRQGLELAAQYFLKNGASLDLNYSWTVATYQSAAQIFSVRSDSAYIGSPLYGSNDVQAGDHMPLVPAYQIKAGGMSPIGKRLQVGVDARYTGPQWFLGDEANQTYPLNGYFSMGARVGVTFGPWEMSGVVDNVLNSTAAIFGTFNQDRLNGQLERFLTPQNAISFKFIVRRSLGGGD
ncbi:MAG: TonB-dependent receptor [Gemmatimonadales bacterium]